MFAGKKNCYADELWQQTFLQILHRVWTPKRELKNGPKNGARIWSSKWGPKNGTPKWGPKMAPQNGVQKWHPKGDPISFLHPKMGSKNGTPKWSRKMAPKKGVKMQIKSWFLLDWDIGSPFGYQDFICILTPFLGAIFRLHFGVPFLDPILGCKFLDPFWWSNSGTIFGSIFQLPFWGPKHGAKFAKMFAAKAHLHSNFFPANMNHKMHV